MYVFCPNIDHIPENNEWRRSSQDLRGDWATKCCADISPDGELAQMVERSLSMREVVGSMPTFSREGSIS